MSPLGQTIWVQWDVKDGFFFLLPLLFFFFFWVGGYVCNKEYFLSWFTQEDAGSCPMFAPNLKYRCIHYVSEYSVVGQPQYW